MKHLVIAGCAAYFALQAQSVSAQSLINLGYTALSQQQGGVLPSGSVVAVTQVEAGFPVGYAPDASMSIFAGKTITPRSGTFVSSGHATTVAANFYGTASSMAPGITNIDVYNADDWLNQGILNFGQAAEPKISLNGSRIANHSWVGASSNVNENLQILLRADWLAARDDQLQIVGVNNGSGSGNPVLMSAGMNMISVGTSSLVHVTGSTPIGSSIYSTAHPRPDLVASEGATSFATPHVSSAAALLIAGSQANPNWSLPQPGMGVATSSSPRSGPAIVAAETSEVIRAALMAGAERTYINEDGVRLLDYRVNVANQSTNGLDLRVGAGQLNVRNAWNILAGGLQHSQEDGNTTNIAATGFDYDNLIATGATGTYDFVGAWTGQTFSTTLAWNAKINLPQVYLGLYNSAATLDNLNLRLTDLTAGTIVSSSSTTENTENISTSLIAGHQYRLEVLTVGTVATDYGLAWNGASNQVWRGSVDGMWNVDDTANWQRGNSAAKFLNNDHVVFNDETNVNAVTLATAVQPDSVTFANSTKNYTLSGLPGAGIVGPGILIKNGTGTLTLSNANSYSGTTFLNAGIIRAGAANALSTNSLVQIATGATLDLNGFSATVGGVAGSGTVQLAGGTLGTSVVTGETTFSGNIAGSGAIQKFGLGTQTFTGDITTPNFAATVTWGTLRFALPSTANVQFASDPTVTIGPAVLELSGAKSALADGLGHLAGVVSTSNTSVLNVTGTNQRVGGISGPGTTNILAGADLTANGLRQTALSLATGGKLTISQNGGNAGLTILNQVPTIAGTGRVDLVDNELLVDYTGALGTQLTVATSLIAAARNGVDGGGLANWNGAGIGSSEVRANNLLAGFDRYTIGIVNNADLTTIGLSPAYATFAGESVDPTTLLIATTFNGDADLNGVVDLTDRLYWVNGYTNANPPGIAGWVAGDFNYDQLVDLNDYKQWLNVYLAGGNVDQTFLNSDPYYIAVMIPEPSVLGLSVVALGIGSLALRKRRRIAG